jgi:hypothetical protein
MRGAIASELHGSGEPVAFANLSAAHSVICPGQVASGRDRVAIRRRAAADFA